MVKFNSCHKIGQGSQGFHVGIKFGITGAQSHK